MICGINAKLSNPNALFIYKLIGEATGGPALTCVWSYNGHCAAVATVYNLRNRPNVNKGGFSNSVNTLYIVAYYVGQ